MTETVPLYNNIIPYEKLMGLAKDRSSEYAEALPFAHGVFDNVFEPKVLDAVLEEFDAPETWKEYDTKYEKKLQMHKDLHMGPATRAFIHNLNSEPFIDFLEELTGIKGIIPDPYLVGAGCHKIPKGGKLGVHVDFNTHGKMKLARRINVLVYLNKDWKEEYGGHFELWDEKKASCQKKILPIYNRMAIFSTTETSFHGHPEPLTCPDGWYRKSIALYYYTVFPGTTVGKKQQHSTVFINKDGKKEELGKKTFMQKLVAKSKKLVGM